MSTFSPSTNLRRQAFWLLDLRWVAIGALIAATLVPTHFMGIHLAKDSLLILSGVLVVYNGCMYAALRLMTRSQGPLSGAAMGRMITLQISVDLLALTVILHFSGGIENPFSLFFVFHMIIAGILCSQRQSYLQAGLAFLLFGSLVWLERGGVLPHHALEGFADHGLYADAVFVQGTMFVFGVTLFLVVFMTTSIAEQLRTQQGELEEANMQLEKKDRIKDEYVLRVTHDLKGHLAAIQSCIDTVHDGLLGPINEAQKDMIARSHRRTVQALGFISDLLKLTHARLSGRASISCFPFKVMIGRALAAAKSAADAKAVHMSADVAPSVDIVCGEQVLIEEAMENLLFNAVKYTPQGGKVRLEVRDQGDAIVVRVQDTGIGIPADEIDKIFGEFYRATNARNIDCDGTGLGLAFVRQVVTMHGGRVWAENNPGGGAMFSVLLPKHSDLLAQASREEP